MIVEEALVLAEFLDAEVGLHFTTPSGEIGLEGFALGSYCPCCGQSARIGRYSCPDIPDLRYSELLIALVYTWGMQEIYEIVLTFFGVYKDNVSDVAYLLCIIPLKQLSGFKWWRTSLYVILSYLAALAILFAVMLAAVEIQILLESL